MIEIAAHALEAAPEDLVVGAGRISMAGSPSMGLSIKEVAHLAYIAPSSLPPGMPMGLEAQSRYTPSSPITWSNSCHVCVCEVDAVTGAVAILRFIVSEDCGVMINPSIVEGQIAGGAVQGIGGVLLEDFVYDEHGNPLTSTFMDYLLPTATDVPEIEFGHIETPASTPGHYKGVGEGGAIGAPAAVANAVNDALSLVGAHVAVAPFTPGRIVEALVAVDR
jgi:carbon-monoxide dehydrogenase large subunit